MEEEIWKAVPGYETYMVSSYGNVKSLNYRMSGKEKLLKPGISHGYYFVILYKNGKRKNFDIQMLVAMAFLGHVPCGNKLVVDHINSNPLDNRLQNLQIITHRKNCSKEKTLKSGLPVGVYYYKRTGKYMSRIGINGKLTYLGDYQTPEDASEAYQNALKNILKNS